MRERAGRQFTGRAHVISSHSLPQITTVLDKKEQNHSVKEKLGAIKSLKCASEPSPAF